MTDRSGRGRLRAFVREYPAREALGDAWHEHRWHVAFAAGLFAFGIVVGAALALAGINLLELFVEFTGQSPFDVEEDELTARFFIVNNSVPFLLSIAGAASLGTFTAFIMVFNGILVGNVAAFVVESAGVGFILVGLLPHGIFELPALFVAAGVGFRVFHRFVQRLLGRRDAFVSKRYLYRTLLLVVVGWLMLAVAAVVEAHVTPALLDALFGEGASGVESTDESANATVAAIASLLP